MFISKDKSNVLWLLTVIYGILLVNLTTPLENALKSFLTLLFGPQCPMMQFLLQSIL